MPMTNAQLLEALAESRRTMPQRCSAAEWEMRVELAACYRLVAHYRMTDWIYNHISAAVPGEPGHYLINAFGLLYEEISASNLVKVDLQGRRVDPVPYDVNPAAFVIHGALHQARPDAVCVLHTHTAAGVAVSAGSVVNGAHRRGWPPAPPWPGPARLPAGHRPSDSRHVWQSYLSCACCKAQTH